MAKKIRDTDYLAVSAQVRAMENTLLTRDRLEQVASARSVEEAVKVVQEFGYPDLTSAAPEAIDAAILRGRRSLQEELNLPDGRVMDIFKLKHDYHNLKALLKSRHAGVSADHILLDLGRVSPAELKRAVEEGEWDILPEALAAAAREAKEILDTTRDGQLMDIFLDRACYREELDMARESGSDFLVGYIRRRIDSANLRALVRTLRMKKTADFLQQVLITGGDVGEAEILTVSQNEGAGLLELYAPTAFAAAAEQASLAGGALTEFERLCDDAVAEYLEMARFVPFGEQAVIAYLAARETEFTNLRIALLGRSMDLPAEVICARLRA